MMRRFRIEKNRIICSYPYIDTEATAEIRQIEGRRWSPTLKQWSVPSSLRCLENLKQLGFSASANSPALEQLLASDSPHLAPLSIAPTSVGTLALLPFQLAGLEYLLARKRAALCDDPGVGKTAQAVAWSRDDHNILVVAPKAVLHQWADLYRECGREVAIRPSGQLSGLAITNYEQLARVEPKGEFTLIVDECHYVKNPKASRSKVVLKYSDAASKVLAISATPTINKPIELWPLYLMMKEREPNEFWHWAMRYTGAYRHDFGWDFSGATHLDELRRDMLHFMLRRSKEQVLKELPEVRRTDLKVDINASQNKSVVQSEVQVSNFLSRGRLGETAAELQRLRQVLSGAKSAPAIEYLNTHLSGEGGPVVVFCEFVETAVRIASAMGTTAFTGETEDSVRREVLSGYLNGDAKVFVCTTPTAGVGLDGLQRTASMGIFVDLPWTPASLEQAEGRIHRRGQMEGTHFVTLLCGSALESKMLEALRRKKDIVEYLMEGPTGLNRSPV